LRKLPLVVIATSGGAITPDPWQFLRYYGALSLSVANTALPASKISSDEASICLFVPQGGIAQSTLQKTCPARQRPGQN
jgi:hypothetical protein